MTANLTLREKIKEVERELIVFALNHFKWVKKDVANSLGISRKNLWEKILQHNITPEKDRLHGAA